MDYNKSVDGVIFLKNLISTVFSVDLLGIIP